MSIKQSIAALLILFSVSFSAFGSGNIDPTYKVTDKAAYPDCGLYIGQRLQPSSVVSCFENKYVNYKNFYTTSCYTNTDRYGVSIICNTKGYQYPTYRVAFFDVKNAQCPTGYNQLSDGYNLSCEPINKCDFGMNEDGSCMDACQFKHSIADTVDLHWQPAIYGELVTGACYGDYGATRCEMTKNSSTILCTGVPDGEYTPESQCTLNFAYTGRQCDGGNEFWGVDGPDKPIGPENPDPETGGGDGDTGSGGDIGDGGTLPETGGGDGDTGSGGDIGDGGTLPDGGGAGGGTGDGVNPDQPADKPDVEEPEVKPETDTAVMQAVMGLNEDINQSLHNLNADMNKQSADVQNQMLLLNDAIVQSSNKTDSAIEKANTDITSAVNATTDAVNSLGSGMEGISNSIDGLGSEIGALGDAVNGIGDSVDGIGEAVNSLGNLDLVGPARGTCPFHQAGKDCNGYYESAYPYGFEGIAEEHFAGLETQVKGVVDGMFKLDVSNASAPSFCINVMQFGRHCFTEYMNLSAIFAFIRACMMFGAVMLCRQLVFGG
ncbi:methyl-accepting chemotaxis protein [Vibrio natriegens]|uniref:methyl-accepting chemotaxis protein n=1 Tax=Vibrio natriegens TaxID=691 RepID=UPI001EFD1578|nr:methyl-accepting chemotaxis protein [Vibrio natriegens]MCG9703281.1 methyl-accepting chemotaxis protein [Vibrio natriegens]